MAMPDMGKMYGPLPLGAWLAVVGGGLGLMYIARNHQSAPEVDDPSVNTSGYEDVGMGGPTGGGSGTSPVANGPAVVAETNEMWQKRVYSEFTKNNPAYDAYQVSVALAKYLEGQGLSPWEQTVITIILARYGLPPNPPPSPWGGVGTGGGGTQPTPVPVTPLPVTPIPVAPRPVILPENGNEGNGGGGKASAPSGLHVINISHDSATVGWNNSSNATGYNVYLNGARYRTNVPRSNPNAGDARCHFEGLGSKKKYTVKVVSRNGAGSEGGAVSMSMTTK